MSSPVTNLQKSIETASANEIEAAVTRLRAECIQRYQLASIMEDELKRRGHVVATDAAQPYTGGPREVLTLRPSEVAGISKPASRLVFEDMRDAALKSFAPAIDINAALPTANGAELLTWVEYLKFLRWLKLYGYMTPATLAHAPGPMVCLPVAVLTTMLWDSKVMKRSEVEALPSDLYTIGVSVASPAEQKREWDRAMVYASTGVMPGYT